MFEPLGHQKRRVFRSLGRDGSDGQACREIGPSSSSKTTQKWLKRIPFGATFRQSSVKQRHPERDGSQVGCFFAFLKDLALDPLQSGMHRGGLSAAHQDNDYILIGNGSPELIINK